MTLMALENWELTKKLLISQMEVSWALFIQTKHPWRVWQKCTLRIHMSCAHCHMISVSITHRVIIVQIKSEWWCNKQLSAKKIIIKSKKALVFRTVQMLKNGFAQWDINEEGRIFLLCEDWCRKGDVWLGGNCIKHWSTLSVSFKIEITQVQWKVIPWHTWQGHSSDVNHTKSHNPEHESSCSLCLCHDPKHLSSEAFTGFGYQWDLCSAPCHLLSNHSFNSEKKVAAPGSKKDTNLYQLQSYE